MANENYLLELKGISKSFKDVKANDNISLHLQKGEVLALLGENGAGKSTLMNIIYGIYKPDSGQIFVNGSRANINSVKDAMFFSIGMVHQHFMLIGRFNAVENIILISDDKSFSVLNKKKVKDRLEELKAQFGIDVDLDCPVEQLSISMQQKVEILKVLYVGAEILILDEPTAVLLPAECESLFKIIRNMTSLNKGVIFISHKLDEVLEISDRINVLSAGRVTGEVKTADANKDIIVTMMSGEDALKKFNFEKEKPSDIVIMNCKDLAAKDDRGVQTLNHVDLTIHKGEIVGIAGVEGNGQEELAQVLAGVRNVTKGSIEVAGENLKPGKTKEFMEKGVAYIPSDRNHTGTVSDFSLVSNWLLRKIKVPKKFGLLDNKKINEDCKKGMEKFDVRAKDQNVRSANLSGGNLQKFILAREMEEVSNVLICSYPTRGLDIKASYSVRSRLLEAKKNGSGILVLSSDLEELFAICDRIVVLYRGEIIGECDPNTASTGDVVYMMMGGKA
ncbi:MAG: ABC transporter ATP-binding protein [Erysipelotrichaceae bacterium]|nr:ABC transporter ATP-binding protein [Erysipelotrichaceae bacterium]